MKKILLYYPILQNILYVKKKITQYFAVKSDFYSPLPEYPADCRSAAKIPSCGAAGSFIIERIIADDVFKIKNQGKSRP